MALQQAGQQAADTFAAVVSGPNVVATVSFTDATVPLNGYTLTPFNVPSGVTVTCTQAAPYTCTLTPPASYVANLASSYSFYILVDDTDCPSTTPSYAKQVSLVLTAGAAPTAVSVGSSSAMTAVVGGSPVTAAVTITDTTVPAAGYTVSVDATSVATLPAGTTFTCSGTTSISCTLTPPAKITAALSNPYNIVLNFNDPATSASVDFAKTVAVTLTAGGERQQGSVLWARGYAAAVRDTCVNITAV